MKSDLNTTLERAGRTHVRHRVLRVVLKSLPWAVLAIVLFFAVDILLHLPSDARAWIRNGLLAISLLLIGAASFTAFFRSEPVLRTARIIEGRMPGKRFASMDFPVPGGPIINRLWPPAGGNFYGAFGVCLAFYIF